MQTPASVPVAIGSQQSAQSAALKPKLLDQVRQAIRAQLIFHFRLQFAICH